jgi:hypothetical protein
MEKIAFVVNGENKGLIPISPNNTIRDIKKSIEQWIGQWNGNQNDRKVTNIRIIFVDNTELDPVVFSSNKYDKVNFSSKKGLLNGGKIEITTEKVKTRIENFDTLTGLPKDVIVSILGKLSYDDILKTCSLNKSFLTYCQDKNLWRTKLRQDFPKRSQLIPNKNLADLYREAPLKLYEIINQKSKIFEIGKEMVPRTFEQYSDPEDLLEDDETAAEMLTEELKDFVNKNEVLRGDIFHLKWAGEYRNDGKFIWSGTEVLPLANEPDDYGNVPKSFAFPEFSFDHFTKSIDHNNILWLSKEKIEEAIRNFEVSGEGKEKTSETYITDNYYKYYFKYNPEQVDEHLTPESFTLTKNQFIKDIKYHPYVDNIDNLFLGEMVWQYHRKELI